MLLLLFALLCFFMRYRRTGTLTALLSFVILLIFSTGPLPHYLLNSLSAPYQPLTQYPSNIKFIVVLGGGNKLDGNYPPIMRLNSSTLSRLLEGIRLHKNIPNSQLILSGGKAISNTADALLMEQSALMLGVSKNNIKVESHSQDTFKEVLLLKEMIGTKPFILVTSSYHMKRAMLLFHQHNMNPIAAPTQFFQTTPRQPAWRYYFPNSSNLVKSDIAIHEYLGMGWYHLTSKI